jgi:Cupredoxin-like domain
MKTYMSKFLLAFVLIFPGSASVVAAPVKEYTVTIRNHRFVPAEITIPAKTKVKLIVINEDATPEEFESHELNREKIVAGKARITVFIGPLKPGRYPFFGEFNPKTAQGAIVAK